MYNARKRLQAIRRQLMHMDEQYRDGLDHDGNNSTIEPENCRNKPEEVVRKESSEGFSIINFPASQTVDTHDPEFSSSMDIRNVLGSIADCSTSGEVDDIPLTEELQSAISNMEDLDDVDSPIGNVISAVQVDSFFDQDLEPMEESVTSSGNPLGDLVNYQTTTSSGSDLRPLEGSTKQFMTSNQEESWRKDRRKKDNHNIIERRRRYYINDRIKELATLLPSSIPPDLKQNKGSILKASVEYVKELKRDKHRLHQLEVNQRTMDSKYQKLLFRIFQLELKIKLYGLTEGMDDVRIKKKKPKRRMSEINKVVEGFCLQNTTAFHSFQQTEQTVRNSPSCKKNKGAVLKKCRGQKNTPNVKQGLGRRLGKKMAAGRQADDNNVGVSDFFRTENQFEVREKKSFIMKNKNEQATKDTQQSYPNENNSLGTDDNCNVGEQKMGEIVELTSEQCNILLDLFENQGNVNEILINSDIMIQQDNSAPLRESSSKQDCSSLVTSTSNMLKKLLRRSDSKSGSSCLEDSTESTTGLR